MNNSKTRVGCYSLCGFIWWLIKTNQKCHKFNMKLKYEITLPGNWFYLSKRKTK